MIENEHEYEISKNMIKKLEATMKKMRKHPHPIERKLTLAPISVLKKDIEKEIKDYEKHQSSKK